VRDDDQNRFGATMNFEQQIGDDFRGFLIEISGRLVAQEQLRLHDQRARECNALFFTTRELRRTVVQTFGESDLFE
jgi:hypothetical protein